MVFEHLLVRDGRLTEAKFREPFDVLVAVPRFEPASLADLALHKANSFRQFRGRPIRLTKRCADADNGANTSAPSLGRPILPW